MGVSLVDLPLHSVLEWQVVGQIKVRFIEEVLQKYFMVEFKQIKLPLLLQRQFIILSVTTISNN
jgi:hypothetical protein